MSLTFESIRDRLFGIFYIMTEQNNNIEDRPSSTSTAFCTLIYLIDAGQVLRAIVLPEFGWSHESMALMEKIDLVYFIYSVSIVFLGTFI